MATPSLPQAPAIPHHQRYRRTRRCCRWIDAATMKAVCSALIFLQFCNMLRLVAVYAPRRPSSVHHVAANRTAAAAAPIDRGLRPGLAERHDDVSSAAASSRRPPSVAVNRTAAAAGLMDWPGLGLGLGLGLAERLDDDESSSAAASSRRPPHPHAGARDASGRWGYVADPGLVPRTVPPMTAAEHARLGDCAVADDGEEVLRRVRRGVQRALQRAPPAAGVEQRARNATTMTPTPPVRILCLMYTVSSRRPILSAAATTWGRRCDGFLATSDETVEGVGAADISHTGEETYGNMVQKIWSLLTYVRDHYRDKYDFFHVCGDDTFVILENMRDYLSGPEVTAMGGGRYDRGGKGGGGGGGGWSYDRPLFLGQLHFYTDGKLTVRHSMCSGGPGYTLNRLALDLLLTSPGCNFTGVTDSCEDLFMSGCLLQSQVFCMNTRDAGGAFRYNDWDAAAQQAYREGRGTPWNAKLFSEMCHIKSLYGARGASEQSVAFHVKMSQRARHMNRDKDPNSKLPAKIRRYHALIYGLCDGHDGNANEGDGDIEEEGEVDGNSAPGTEGSANVTYPTAPFDNPQNVDLTQHKVRVQHTDMLLRQSCEAWGGDRFTAMRVARFTKAGKLTKAANGGG